MGSEMCIRDSVKVPCPPVEGRVVVPLAPHAPLLQSQQLQHPARRVEQTTHLLPVLSRQVSPVVQQGEYHRHRAIPNSYV